MKKIFLVLLVLAIASYFVFHYSSRLGIEKDEPTGSHSIELTAVADQEAPDGRAWHKASQMPGFAGGVLGIMLPSASPAPSLSLITFNEEGWRLEFSTGRFGRYESTCPNRFQCSWNLQTPAQGGYWAAIVVDQGITADYVTGIIFTDTDKKDPNEVRVNQLTDKIRAWGETTKLGMIPKAIPTADRTACREGCGPEPGITYGKIAIVPAEISQNK